MIPESLAKLIAEFRKLPAVGLKTATRYAYAVLEMSDSDAEEFVSAITEAKEKIKERCGQSPDTADALALTFAAPVRPRTVGGKGEFANSEYEVV